MWVTSQSVTGSHQNSVNSPLRPPRHATIHALVPGRIPFSRRSTCRRTFCRHRFAGHGAGTTAPICRGGGGTRSDALAPACNDTGSPVDAVPAEDKDYAWIRSGTGSVPGADVSESIICPSSLKYNFTNEGGVEGTFRFANWALY